MRNAYTIIMLFLITGCSVNTSQHGIADNNYAGLSCAQLASEAKRLAKEKITRNEHLLEDDAARRKAASEQLAAVKKAADERRCTP